MNFSKENTKRMTNIGQELLSKADGKQRKRERCVKRETTRTQHVGAYVGTNIRTYVCMHALHVRMYACIYVCRYVCMWDYVWHVCPLRSRVPFLLLGFGWERFFVLERLAKHI